MGELDTTGGIGGKIGANDVFVGTANPGTLATNRVGVIRLERSDPYEGVDPHAKLEDMLRRFWAAKEAEAAEKMIDVTQAALANVPLVKKYLEK